MQDPIDWAAPPPAAFAQGHSPVVVARSDGSTPTEAVVEEAPITLVFNNQVAITLMATPLQAEALAVGFCLSEGIVASLGELRQLEAVPAGAGLSVLIQLPDNRLAPLLARRRFGAAPGGCGLCGMEDQRALLHLPKPSPGAPLQLAPEALPKALAAMAQQQPVNHATGGAHAALLATPNGAVLALAEDVSRHCALDKAIGLHALAGAEFGKCWALVSSRASFELVAKTARMGLPLLAAMSAPTALALRAAQASGVGLIAFAREGRWSRYV
jgi:FdhD protein